MTYTPSELEELIKTVSSGVFQHFMPLAFADFIRAKKRRLETRMEAWLVSDSQQHNDAVFLIEAQIEILDDLLFELDDKHRGTQEETDRPPSDGDGDDRNRSGHT